MVGGLFHFPIFSQLLPILFTSAHVNTVYLDQRLWGTVIDHIDFCNVLTVVMHVPMWRSWEKSWQEHCWRQRMVTCMIMEWKIQQNHLTILWRKWRLNDQTLRLLLSGPRPWYVIQVTVAFLTCLFSNIYMYMQSNGRFGKSLPPKWLTDCFIYIIILREKSSEGNIPDCLVFTRCFVTINCYCKLLFTAQL